MELGRVEDRTRKSQAGCVVGWSVCGCGISCGILTMATSRLTTRTIRGRFEPLDRKGIRSRGAPIRCSRWELPSGAAVGLQDVPDSGFEERVSENLAGFETLLRAENQEALTEGMIIPPSGKTEIRRV